MTIRIGLPIDSRALAAANDFGYECIVAEAKKRIEALKGSARAE